VKVPFPARDIFALHARGAIPAGGHSAWVKKKREVYGALTDAEAVAVAEAALAVEDEDLREEVLLHLACLSPGSLRDVQPRLAVRGIHWPAVLYWRAGAETRDILLGALERVDVRETVRISHLVSSLAWVGDAVAQTSFATWRESPPAWAKALYVPVHAYAPEAGWELTSSGGRRELCSRDAYRLEVTADETEDALVVAQGAAERCPWLDRPLVRLLDLPTDHRSLGWLKLTGPRLTILTCSQASCFTHVFCELDANGVGSWSPKNVRPDYLGGPAKDYEPLRTTRMKVSRNMASPLEAHESVSEGGTSALGGFPSWVQDAEYPGCPGCGRLMCFVGQVAVDDLVPEGGDGMYFAFVCSDCRVAATGYQQT
jgi:hypothetical protein